MIFQRSCREVHRLVAESLDRELPFWERVELRVHLQLCVECTRFKKQMQFLRDAMRRIPQPD
jgi:hypothetical protein